MRESRDNLIVGIDMTGRYRIVSYYLKNMKEPESVSLKNGEHKYLIPREKYNNVQLVNIAARASDRDRAEEVMLVGDTSDEAECGRFRNDLIQAGYSQNKIKTVSKGECFASYVLNQEDSLRNNEVVMFELEEEAFRLYRIRAGKSKPPHTITVEEEDLSEELDMNLLHERNGFETCDGIFYDLIERTLGKNLVSSVYLLGTGFNERWYVKSLSLLCRKRRVFLGQNLLSLGACYSYALGDRSSDFRLFCEGRTSHSISVLTFNKGKVLLSEAGARWYEADAQIEGILKTTELIEFVFSFPVPNIIRSIKIPLEGFPVRPDKTTRVKICIHYQNSREFTICISDKGFGDLFRSSGLVIEKRFNVEDYEE